MNARQDAASLLAELREAFAHSFAARPEPPQPHEELIALRAGEAAVALRLAALDGLARAPATAPLPGGPAGLRGLAAWNGRVLAVWDLATILGRGRAERADWLVVVGHEQRIGLAFDTFEGHFRVPRGTIAGIRAPDGALVTETVDLDGQPRGLLDVPATLAWIARRAAPARTSEEH